MDVFELDRPRRGRREFGEHAAACDGLELVWVADQHDPQIQALGEVGEPPQVRGRDHPGLVDDHGCPAL